VNQRCKGIPVTDVTGAQVCAFCSPFLRSMSEMGILRQLSNNERSFSIRSDYLGDLTWQILCDGFPES
jgi:hypothetical protein